MKLEINTIWESDARTLSEFRMNGLLFCFSLEDGYKDKKIYGETRIPSGIYKVKKRTYGKFFDRYSKKYGHKFAIEIVNVPEFSDILIHIGNSPSDTKGCVLVAMGIAKPVGLGVGPELRSSEAAYLELYSQIERAFERKENINIHIRSNDKHSPSQPTAIIEPLPSEYPIPEKDTIPPIPSKDEQPNKEYSGGGCARIINGLLISFLICGLILLLWK